jgi:hypothetical protein
MGDIGEDNHRERYSYPAELRLLQEMVISFPP